MRLPDPYKVFRFVVEINGTRVGGFSEITGLEVRTEVDEHREGGVNDYGHKIAKETHCHPVGFGAIAHASSSTAITWSSTTRPPTRCSWMIRSRTGGSQEPYQTPSG